MKTSFKFNTERREIKSGAMESQLFRVRVLFGFFGVFIMFLALVVHYARMQIGQHEKFQLQAQSNQIELRPIAAARGLIYDRRGRVLADHQLGYRIELIPERIKNIEQTIKDLSQIININADDIVRFRALLRRQRRFESIPLKFQLSEDEMARFALDAYRFPGVEAVPYLTRVYPMGDLFGHVVGYVGRIDADDLDQLDPSRYRAVSHLGKTGLEKFYESQLLGHPGFERVEKNADGRALRVLSQQAPSPGTNLHLSIDADLQRVAVDAFEGRSGAAVAIDPRNGEVLALASVPSFDPNLFVNGISYKDYQQLLDDPWRPMYDRALRGLYEPGSTIKPFVALAGLEYGLRKPEDLYFSTGVYRVPGFKDAFHDYRRGGHGAINLTESLAQSVNTYYYSLAVQMGIDRFSGYLGQFGFGQVSQIDLPGESTGVLPSRAWKKAKLNKAWYPGETALVGIGQSYWVTTPVQLATAVATLANKGVYFDPHVVRATQTEFGATPRLLSTKSKPSFVHDQSNLIAVRNGMEAVIHGATGTGRLIGIGATYRIAAKSGTAQRFRRREGQSERSISANLRHKVLFIAFAPSENPEIALAVVLEHGSSGSTDVGPIARKIMDAWLLRDRRLQP